MRVAVAGALGRMGSGIVRKVVQQEDMQLVAAIEAPGRAEAGRRLGELLGIPGLEVRLSSAEELGEVLRSSGAQVLIDFTNPEASVAAAETAAEAGVDLVIGTTGFTEEQKRRIEEAVRRHGVAAVLSPNMSPGMNVFFLLVRRLAELLPEYEVEVVELHHRHKKDSPSGTALRIGEVIAQARGVSLEECARYGRGREIAEEERDRREICFHALRAGDAAGEHTVLFAGEGERIELVHRAHSRECFISGAIRAARFVVSAEKGRVYSTLDVLGIG
ncbi:MAG: 4-hydroxy-tetrahydrodipicolinate reductase [Euryarchaeota archaeon]|nr:4-hydroxy-tetrahydrodipicolinate reductase [Euryarchaeota archaeon]